MAYGATKAIILENRLALIRSEERKEGKFLYTRTRIIDTDRIERLIKDAYQSYVVMVKSAYMLTEDEYIEDNLEEVFNCKYIELELITIDEYKTLL